jgi:ferric-chelate reductase (NADPH)
MACVRVTQPRFALGHPSTRMVSGQAILGAALGRFLFREVETTETRQIAPDFRRVAFAGPALRDVVWEPGDKIQVFIPGRGMRTYTPFAWDARKGSAELLVYTHGMGPGSAWGARLAVGDRWQFFGPRRSIRASELAAQVIVFGDETSFGLARALSDAKGAERVVSVFEANDAAIARDALTALDLARTAVVARAPADVHLVETCDALIRALDAWPSASLVMTGRAQSIQLVRARLKEKGALRGGKVKAYWAVGKSGLD